MPLEYDEMKGFDWGTKTMEINCHGKNAVQMKPVELHHKADGDIEDNPSFAIVLTHPDPRVPVVIGQFSLNTIQKALADIGYTLYQP